MFRAVKESQEKKEVFRVIKDSQEEEVFRVVKKKKQEKDYFKLALLLALLLFKPSFAGDVLQAVN